MKTDSTTSMLVVLYAGAHMLSRFFPSFGGRTSDTTSEERFEPVDLSNGVNHALVEGAQTMVVNTLSSLGSRASESFSEQAPTLESIDPMDSQKELGSSSLSGVAQGVYGLAMTTWDYLPYIAVAVLTWGLARQWHQMTQSAVRVENNIHINVSTPQGPDQSIEILPVVKEVETKSQKKLQVDLKVVKPLTKKVKVIHAARTAAPAA